MTPVLVAVLAAAPCVYWTQGIESRAALQSAGVAKICVAPEQVDTWRAAGFIAVPITNAELASRQELPAPGVTARAGLASPTRSPWVVASGWRIMRAPAAKYIYRVPAGKGALALAEAIAYGADAVLSIEPSDLANVGAMMAFFADVAAADLPPIADFAVIDDGSPVTGEVMNLLARRNLLFQVVKAPVARFRLNIRIGSAEYSREEAADPSAFALKIRNQLTDDQRSLRVYGSEVVIGRLTGDAGRVRLQLLNYGGRDIEGLRIRVRGRYRSGEAYVTGVGEVALADYAVTDDATEFSIPRLATYAVIDLK
jgi:hypothetical protein